MEAGVDILKLFPGDLFGPAFIKDIRGPPPYAKIMPTGGVDISMQAIGFGQVRLLSEQATV